MDAAALGEPVDEWANQAHRLTSIDPKGYARRIVLMALGGAVILHSVWALALLGALALTATAAWLSTWVLLLPAGLLLVLAFAWLWMLVRPVTRDYGVRVDRATAPKLVDLVEQVSEKLGAPKPTHLFLVPDFNAWVQVGRRAKGEWRMSLGLPLMLATDVAQLTAVIGHELGHFVSGTAGARLVWSQQAGWQSTLAQLGGTPLGFLVLRTFRAWGMRFQAESVAMARNHERASDQAGAKVAGAETAGKALTTVDLLERTLWERFWPMVWARAGEGDGLPPDDVFIDLRHFLEATRYEDYDAYYRSALAEATLPFDVHPSLSDRLHYLGVRPSLPAPPSPSAAVALLGNQLDSLSQRLGRWWVIRVERAWKLAGEARAAFAERIREQGKLLPTELHPHESHLLAIALRNSGRVADAVPYYRRAVELGSAPSARLGLGLALLELGDAKGMVELRNGVMASTERDHDVMIAFLAVRRFLEARGERAEKNPFTRDYHRLRLNEARSDRLGEWNQPTLF